MTESTKIKIDMPVNSGFVRPESSHRIPAVANSGTMNPPGILKVFSEVDSSVFRSFKVANTVPR